MIRLPPTRLSLAPSWDDASEERWLEVREASDALRDGVPMSQDFLDTAQAIRALLKRDATDEVIEETRSRSGARALAWLWCEVDGDCRDTASVQLIDAIRQYHPQPGLLLLSYLEIAYFAQFDHLDLRSPDETFGKPTEPSASQHVTTRGALARFLGEGWAHHSRYSAEQIVMLTDEDAPALVARSISSHYASVVDGLAEWRLKEHTGRFVELVRQFLYLDQLLLHPMGEGGPLLDELRLPEVHGAPHLRGRLLGHAALTILIDRAEWTFPGEIWRDVVLDIAGDPRLNHLPNFTQWWAVLGDERAERVMGWLARADLALFLEVLQKFSETQPDMQRMLPARRKLLEGLVDEGLLRRSRLFLGNSVRKFVAFNTPANQVWDSALLTGGSNSERALLYLDCGDFHIVEGSHNTKLWIFVERPAERLTNPRSRSFSYKELTSELAEQFEARRYEESGENHEQGHVSVTHLGLWQSRFLEFLANRGVAVNPEAVLDRLEYLKLRERGLPVVRHGKS